MLTEIIRPDPGRGAAITSCSVRFSDSCAITPIDAVWYSRTDSSRTARDSVMNMPGIRTEVYIFLVSVVTGMVVRLVYRCISSFRQIVRHSFILIEIEDLIYWTGTAIYVFVQIYHTNSGTIRWYSTLGLVLGAVIMTCFLKKCEKMYKKIYIFQDKRLEKKS